MLSLDEILFDEEQHIYRYRNKDYDSVTQVIRLAGLGDDFSMVNPERMEYAQRRGRMVHLATQYYDEGCLDMDSVAGGIKPYVEAYVRFRTECQIKPIAIEQKMVDPAMKLAGRPDLICFIHGRRSVVDRKTSQHMGRSMGLQTAGYAILWAGLHPNETIYDRYGLRLEKTGKYKLIPHEDAEDFRAFADCKEAANSERRMEPWRLKYKKGA